MNKELREMQDIIVDKQEQCQKMLDEKKVDEAKSLVEEIKELKAEMAVKTEMEELNKMNIEDKAAEVAPVVSQKDADIKAFADFIRTTKANEQNFTVGNNGAVIPETIAQMIIAKVEELCPILERAQKFYTKGKLKIPVYGAKTVSETEHDITVAYASDFNELTADAGAFTSVDLVGYLAGVLTLIGKSLINNSDIDIVNFVVAEVSKKVASFVERELLNGTENYVTGALATTNVVTAASTSAITADELIDLQMAIPTAYQQNACWIMNPATFKAVRKLKYTGSGEYLVIPDFTAAAGYSILGKPVFLSDHMPVIAAETPVILYGDLSGYAVKITEEFEMQILREKYATQHAIGICGYIEFDGNVIDHQKLATLTMGE